MPRDDRLSLGEGVEIPFIRIGHRIKFDPVAVPIGWIAGQSPRYSQGKAVALAVIATGVSARIRLFCTSIGAIAGDPRSQDMRSELLDTLADPCRVEFYSEYYDSHEITTPPSDDPFLRYLAVLDTTVEFVRHCFQTERRVSASDVHQLNREKCLAITILGCRLKARCHAAFDACWISYVEAERDHYERTRSGRALQVHFSAFQRDV